MMQEYVRRFYENGVKVCAAGTKGSQLRYEDDGNNNIYYLERKAKLLFRKVMSEYNGGTHVSALVRR